MFTLRREMRLYSMGQREPRYTLKIKGEHAVYFTVESTLQTYYWINLT